VRILYVVPSLASGGAEYQVLRQAQRLVLLGHEVTVVVISRRAELANQLINASIRVEILGFENAVPFGRASIVSLLPAAAAINRLIHDTGVDKVIAVLPVAHYACRLARLFTRQKYSLWIYHHSMQYQASPLDTRAKRFFEYIINRVAAWSDSGHLFISKAVWQNIAENAFVVNGHLIYNGILPVQLDTSLARRYLASLGGGWGEYLLIPGRIQEVKGQARFIREHGNFLKRRGVSCVLAGTGPDQARVLEEVGRQGLGDKVHVTGDIENNLMLSLMGLSRCVLMPSISEGLGITAIEAMAQQATLVVSNVGGLCEIVDDPRLGMVFDWGQPEQLDAILRKVFDGKVALDKERQAAVVEERFTIEKNVASLLLAIDSQ
jgi:glycosyltransferase involved in cell wall biosynthesis